MVLGLTLITFIYGTISVVPAIIENEGYPLALKCFLFSMPTWLSFGVLGHIYYIRKRNSFALKLLPVPFEADPLPVFEEVDTSSYPKCQHFDTSRVSSLGDQTAAFGKQFRYYRHCSEYMLYQSGDKLNILHIYASEDGQGGRGENSNYLGPNPGQVMELLCPGADNPNVEWHTCAACKIRVPPRTWHCGFCGQCVLRRDHHCIFAMACVGEQNQANFLGFIFYMAMGCGYAFLMGALCRQKHDVRLTD